MAVSSTTASLQGADRAVGQPPPLRRNLQFQALLIGQTASALGVDVAAVAYPLVILALTGSPARAGLFSAVLTVGMLAGGLPGGQLADRRDRRTIVIAGESVRALTTMLVVAGLVLGWLSLPLLLVAAVVLGAAQSVIGAARLPLVRSVVPAPQLTRALVQDEVRQNGTALAGPPLAGLLFAIRALGHAVPFVFTAAAFALAALAAVAMGLLPVPAGLGSPASADDVSGAVAGESGGDPAVRPPGKVRQESGMLAGVALLWRSPVLRATMLLIMIVNMTGSGLDLAVIVILRHQHYSSAAIGLALAAGAVGGLAGAPLVRILHRLQPGVLLLSAGMLWVPLFALIALPFGAWWVAALLLIGMLAVPAVKVLLDVLVIRQVPDAQRGRVIAAVMTLVAVGIPVGVAGTGLLLQLLSAQSALLVLVAVLALGVLGCATQRQLWRARWPS